MAHFRIPQFFPFRLFGLPCVGHAIFRGSYDDGQASIPIMTQHRACNGTLPPEIWDQVLRSLTDEPQILWTTLRNVSLPIRMTVDLLLAKYSLPRTVVEPVVLGIPIRLRFSHLDLGRAFFKDAEPDEYYVYRGQRVEDIARLWQRSVNIYNGDGGDVPRFARPRYTVQIEGLINDTELSETEIDYPNRTLSFNWKQSFQHFFTEEAAVRCRKLRLVREMRQIGSSETYSMPAQ